MTPTLEDRFTTVAADELQRQNVALSPSLSGQLQGIIAGGVGRLDQSGAGAVALGEAEASLRQVVQVLADYARRQAQKRGVGEHQVEALWVGDWTRDICPIFPWC